MTPQGLTVSMTPWYAGVAPNQDGEGLEVRIYDGRGRIIHREPKTSLAYNNALLMAQAPRMLMQLYLTNNILKSIETLGLFAGMAKNVKIRETIAENEATLTQAENGFGGRS